MTKNVESLRQVTLTFDIVAISETWRTFYIDRAKKQGGGVALYASSVCSAVTL